MPNIEADTDQKAGESGLLWGVAAFAVGRFARNLRLSGPWLAPSTLEPKEVSRTR